VPLRISEYARRTSIGRKVMHCDQCSDPCAVAEVDMGQVEDDSAVGGICENFSHLAVGGHAAESVQFTGQLKRQTGVIAAVSNLTCGGLPPLRRIFAVPCPGHRSLLPGAQRFFGLVDLDGTSNGAWLDGCLRG
jgi:hypothetical protein